MKTMDWKRGAGVACLLMTLGAGEVRAQTRGPIAEPAGIPVYNNGPKTLGNPFSPEYHAAWYQSQVNRIAMMAWMEHDMAVRQAYLADLAAKRKAAAEAKSAENVNENGKVLWTKVGKPRGWGLGQGKIISSVPVESTVVSSTPGKGSAPTIVVESSSMAPVVKDATPMPTDNVAGKATSGKVYELKPDGSMVEISPSATIKSVETGAPTTIAIDAAKSMPKR
jgi:hypothetical protein